MDNNRANAQSFRPMQDIVPRRVRPSGEPVARPESSQISNAPTEETAAQAASDSSQTSSSANPVASQPAQAQVVSVPIVQPDDAQSTGGANNSQTKPIDDDAELESIMEEVHAGKAAAPSGVTAGAVKTKRPILVAIVTLVAAIGLAAVAYFAFSNTQASTTAAPTTSDQIVIDSRQ